MLRKYVSDQFKNPFGLLWQLVRSENPAARSAVYFAIGGIGLMPFDWALSGFEQSAYRRADPVKRPILLVCGPPRSGTTLVAQTIANAMSVTYPNNLTSLFPRSPVTASRLFSALSRPRPGGYKAYYGKSTGLAGLNDALYIWDRWLGANRAEVPDALTPGAETSMPAFFGAWQEQFDLPFINKVNRLNTCASLVADVLPQARFVLLRRDPLSLAQSLYIARRDIVRDLAVPYGTCHTDRNPDDPLDDVCRQVRFHEDCMLAQQEKLGAQQLRVLSYEEFCQGPETCLLSLSDWSGISMRADAPPLPSRFEVSSRRKLDPKEITVLSERLDELGLMPETEPARPS